MINKYLAILIFLTTTLFSQTGDISGVVKDVKTGKALVGANVSIRGGVIGTTTDEDGYFSFSKMSVGTYTVVVNYVGYHTYSQSVNLAEKEVLKLMILLKETAISANAVNIVATRAIEGETPAAFSSIDKEELEMRYYAQDIPVLLSELPSTTFYSENGSGLGYTYMSIRGFDQRRISVMINGVPQNDPEDHNVYWVNFPDFLGNVEDIQVQRGAGSAFYGPPAIGGSVNIITNTYSTEKKLSLSGGGGSFGTSKFSVSANTGLLNNRWVVNARASQIITDGYRNSSKLDFKSYFLGAAYFGDRMTTKVQFYGGPIEDELAYLGISKAEAEDPNLRKTNYINDPREIENFNQPHFELINTYQLSENATLNNTLYYIKGYGFFDYQGNWAPFSYYRLTPDFGFDVTGNPEEQYASDIIIRAYVDNNQFGWYPHLTWEHAIGRLIAGAELRTHRSLHWGRIQDGSADLPNAISGEYSGLNYIGERRYYEYSGGKDIVSPFISNTYKINDKLRLNTAFQLLWQRYKLFDEAFIRTDFDISYTFFNPRVGLVYQISPEISTFGSISKTSREPRLKNYYDAAEASTPAAWGAIIPQFEQNTDGSFNFDSPLVKPENLVDYELGISYINPRTEAHINFYYMDFRDEIVRSGQLDRFGQPITGNAPKTLHAGIELSGQKLIAKNLTFGGNLTFSKNELTEYSVFDFDENFNVIETELSGNSIAGFPNFLANARLTYNNKVMQASLQMQHIGKFYTDNFQNDANSVDAYAVFHGIIGYDFGKYLPNQQQFLLQLHIRNIFNNLYIAHGEGSDFFPAADRHFFINASIEL